MRIGTVSAWLTEKGCEKRYRMLSWVKQTSELTEGGQRFSIVIRSEPTLLTDEEVGRMIRLRKEENLSLAALGTMFGVTAERARQVLQQRGIVTARIPAPPKQAKPARRTYDWDEIEYMHDKLEMSSYDIAVELEANPTYIRQGLAQRGALRQRDEAAELKRRQQSLTAVS